MPLPEIPRTSLDFPPKFNSHKKGVVHHHYYHYLFPCEKHHSQHLPASHVGHFTPILKINQIYKFLSFSFIAIVRSENYIIFEDFNSLSTNYINNNLIYENNIKLLSTQCNVRYERKFLNILIFLRKGKFQIAISFISR